MINSHVLFLYNKHDLWYNIKSGGYMKKAHFISKIIIILSVIIFLYLVIFPMTKEKNSDHVNGDMKSYILNKNDLIEYTFTSNVNNLSKVSIYLKGNNIKEKCNINISLYDRSTKISDRIISNRKIKKEHFTSLYFPKISNSKNKKYLLNVQSNCDKSISIYLYDINDNSNMKYNNVETKKGIVVRETAYIKVVSHLRYPIVIFLIGLLVYVMTFDFKGGKNVKKNKTK